MYISVLKNYLIIVVLMVNLSNYIGKVVDMFDLILILFVVKNWGGFKISKYINV